MALYTGRLGLAEAFAAPLTSDRPDGLWPTVVVDERGTALGLCFSNLESLIAALEQGRGVYHSRSRGLWVKGETSGATQELLGIDADCDRDALRFTVRQQPPGFCHLNTRTCWGADRGLAALARRLAERKTAAPPGSYTARLLADPELLGAKLREEAAELAEAGSREHAIEEAADVFYFTLATLARHGIDVTEVEAALDRRALKVTRRA
jgi:phosphoribosyl-AMP cyclohydrolase / phosphoribosyl-ATP pyrophosphohydrolase